MEVALYIIGGIIVFLYLAGFFIVLGMNLMVELLGGIFSPKPNINWRMVFWFALTWPYSILTGGNR